jgi:hypothetical protein
MISVGRPYTATARPTDTLKIVRYQALKYRSTPRIADRRRRELGSPLGRCVTSERRLDQSAEVVERVRKDTAKGDHRRRDCANDPDSKDAVLDRGNAGPIAKGRTQELYLHRKHL